MPWVTIAQTVLTFLLASAIAARLWPLRSIASFNQRSFVLFGSLRKLPRQVDQQVYVFEFRRTHLLDFLAHERGRLTDCAPPRPRKLAEYSKDELKKLLEELNKLMKEDIEAKYEINPECKAKIDGFDATYNAKGDVKLGAGNFEIGTKGATGVTVEVGKSISGGGGEGPVGSASIKISGELNRATGEWDAVAEVGGKVGVGVAVPEIGELACYPGSGEVTLKARSFVRKETMFQRVSEELARR